MFLRPDRDDARLIGFYVGKVVGLLGLFQLIPALLAFALGEWNSLTGLVIGAGQAIITGRITDLRLATDDSLDWSHGMVTAALSWILPVAEDHVRVLGFRVCLDCALHLDAPPREQRLAGIENREGPPAGCVRCGACDGCSSRTRSRSSAVVGAVSDGSDSGLFAIGSRETQVLVLIDDLADQMVVIAGCRHAFFSRRSCWHRDRQAKFSTTKASSTARTHAVADRYRAELTQVPLAPSAGVPDVMGSQLWGRSGLWRMRG